MSKKSEETGLPMMVNNSIKNDSAKKLHSTEFDARDCYEFRRFPKRTINECPFISMNEHRFIERFTDLGKLNLAYCGSMLGLSQFALLPQLPLKTLLNLKVVKIDSKIIISLH